MKFLHFLRSLLIDLFNGKPIDIEKKSKEALDGFAEVVAPKKVAKKVVKKKKPVKKHVNPE
jgi:hypothetical protein